MDTVSGQWAADSFYSIYDEFGFTVSDRLRRDICFGYVLVRGYAKIWGDVPERKCVYELRSLGWRPEREKESERERGREREKERKRERDGHQWKSNQHQIKSTVLTHVVTNKIIPLPRNGTLSKYIHVICHHQSTQFDI